MKNPVTLADRINADVQYRGINARKEHMFANGGLLVSHVFATLEEGVARFGKRIKVDQRVLTHSTVFTKGVEDGGAGRYAPRKEADRQEHFEYGSGYLVGLLGSDK